MWNRILGACFFSILFLYTKDPLRHPLSTFLPSVEVGGGTNDTFLSEHPFSVLVSGKQRRIPWIVGFNADEGLHVTASK